MTTPQSPATPDPAPAIVNGVSVASAAPAHAVAITAIDVPFAKLVVFFFKAFFAAIPALIAAAIVIRLLMGAIAFMIGGWRYGYYGGW